MIKTILVMHFIGHHLSVYPNEPYDYELEPDKGPGVSTNWRIKNPAAWRCHVRYEIANRILKAFFGLMRLLPSGMKKSSDESELAAFRAGLECWRRVSYPWMSAFPSDEECMALSQTLPNYLVPRTKELIILCGDTGLPSWELHIAESIGYIPKQRTWV